MKIDWSDRFWSKCCPEALSGCWLWMAGVRGDGYGAFSLHRSRKQVGAHRHAYELVNGPIPQGMVVMHSCDVPLCVNPDHLSLGTVADNAQDMWRKGRFKPPTGEDHYAVRKPHLVRRGERHPMRKLSANNVAEIREAVAHGERRADIASRFGVTESNINHIARGHTWRSA